MDDATFAREWVAFFGRMSAGRVLGWCVLTGIKLAGEEPTRTSLLQRGWGSTATRYRNVSLLVGFREAMEAKGYDLDDATVDEAREPVRLLRAVA